MQNKIEIFGNTKEGNAWVVALETTMLCNCSCLAWLSIDLCGACIYLFCCQILLVLVSNHTKKTTNRGEQLHCEFDLLGEDRSVCFFKTLLTSEMYCIFPFWDTLPLVHVKWRSRCTSIPTEFLLISVFFFPFNAIFYFVKS